VVDRIWAALSGRVKDADHDVPKINAALREWFAEFTVGRHDVGNLGVQPILSGRADERSAKPGQLPSRRLLVCRERRRRGRRVLRTPANTSRAYTPENSATACMIRRESAGSDA